MSEYNNCCICGGEREDAEWWLCIKTVVFVVERGADRLGCSLDLFTLIKVLGQPITRRTSESKLWLDNET